MFLNYGEQRLKGNCKNNYEMRAAKTVYIDANTIITTVSVITALIVMFSAVFAVYRWYLKQNRQDNEIEKMKKEQCLLTYGVLACLKGLKEQGCNGPVSEAINKIEKHINQEAHDWAE